MSMILALIVLAVLGDTNSEVASSKEPEHCPEEIEIWYRKHVVLDKIDDKTFSSWNLINFFRRAWVIISNPSPSHMIY